MVGTAVEIVPGTLSERAADRLAALTAQAASVPTVLVQLLDGDKLGVIGGFGVPTPWRALTDVPLSATLAWPSVEGTTSCRVCRRRRVPNHRACKGIAAGTRLMRFVATGFCVDILSNGSFRPFFYS